MVKVRYAKDKMLGPRYDVGEWTYGRIKAVGQLGRIIIGKFCSIADGVEAIMGDHFMDRITTYPFNAIDDWPEAGDIPGVSTHKGDLVVGNDVWIGHRATLMSGVTVGDGAVIGARAIVTKDVPPYALAIGGPARVIKKRFDDQTIELLLRIKWWDWPEEKIRENIQTLLSPDIEELKRLAGFDR